MARTVRHHDGISSKYWMTLAGFSALGGIGIAFVAYMIYQSTAASQAVAMSSNIWAAMTIITLSVVGLIVYVPLFKDSAYLRQQRSRWNPDWWKYIAFGLLTPVVIAAAATTIVPTTEALSFGLILHGPSSWLASTAYLYHRHSYVGVP